MSMNHSETEINLFLQLWFNIMDCKRRPMITPESKSNLNRVCEQMMKDF